MKLVSEKNMDKRLQFSYAPLTTADVERSFRCIIIFFQIADIVLKKKISRNTMLCNLTTILNTNIKNKVTVFCHRNRVFISQFSQTVLLNKSHRNCRTLIISAYFAIFCCIFACIFWCFKCILCPPYLFRTMEAYYPKISGQHDTYIDDITFSNVTENTFKFSYLIHHLGHGKWK